MTKRFVLVSALRVRDKAIKILQDENRLLALEIAMLKAKS